MVIFYLMDIMELKSRQRISVIHMLVSMDGHNPVMEVHIQPFFELLTKICPPQSMCNFTK